MAKRPRGIPEVVRPDAKTIQFSFKHLECDHDQFSLDECAVGFWSALARELKRYSSWTTDQFSNPDYNESRHPVDFESTTEVDGFSKLNMDSLEWSENWQFGIGERTRGWRVCGLIVGDIFYLVWLDSGHKLYSITKAEVAKRNSGS